MLREIMKISTDFITIRIPDDLRNKEVELLILPIDEIVPLQKNIVRKLQLTTFKCKKLLRDYTRGDAYLEFI